MPVRNPQKPFAQLLSEAKHPTKADDIIQQDQSDGG